MSLATKYDVSIDVNKKTRFNMRFLKEKVV